MHSPRVPSAGGRRAPIGMLGIFRAPYNASHPAGSGHGHHRPRHNRVAVLAASVLLLTLYWAYLALQPAPQQVITASGAAQQRRPGLPDWLEAQPDTNSGGVGDSSGGKSLHADTSQAVDGVAFAAAIPLNPELTGVLGSTWERAQALQRMRRWEHGLGALQPLPPADILAAGAAALAAGGKLRAANGVGLGVDGALGPHSLGLQSYYAPWILADLALWSHTGISQDLIDKAAVARKKCHGSSLRVFVINGTVWVEHLSPRPKPGWYPSTLGPGWISGKGRVPYVILAVMDVIREYGAEVPDVDFIMGCGDAPCFKLPELQRPSTSARSGGTKRRMQAQAAGAAMGFGSTAASSSGGGGDNSSGGGHIHGSRCRSRPAVDAFGTLLPCSNSSRSGSNTAVEHGSGSDSSGDRIRGGSGGANGGSGSAGGSSSRRALAGKAAQPEVPLPMFLYDTKETHADIPFPDFSYWGHEMDRLCEGEGKYVIGWDAQQPMLARLSQSRPWQRRKPQLTWRGRHGPGRDQLRQDFITCRERLINDSRQADADLFNFWWPDVALPQLSLYRYNVYIESSAWATNFKQKLASGSPVFAIDPRSPEFFSRALRPGVHYLPVSGHDMCNQTVDLIRAMNRNWDRTHGGRTFFDPLSLLPAWPFKWWSETSSPGPSDGKPAHATVDSRSSGPENTTSAAAPAPQRGTAQRDAAKRGASAGSSALQKQATHAVAAVADAAGAAGARRRLQAAQRAAGDPGGQTAGGIDAQRVLDRRRAAAAASAGTNGQSSSSTLSGSSRELLGPAELEVAQAAADADLPLPTDVAAAAEAFLTDHLRMEDVRRYLLDVLRLYAALQTFEVQPTKNAVCYDGAALLGQFGTPRPSDAAVVSGKYPWLDSFGVGGCPPNRTPKDGWEAMPEVGGTGAQKGKDKRRGWWG